MAFGRARSDDYDVRVGPLGLPGILSLARGPMGLVVFAHGHHSSRHSPRSARMVASLRRKGLVTLRLDLLTEEETAAGAEVEMEARAARLIEAVRWATGRGAARGLPVALLGSGAGAAVALLAAAEMGREVACVATRSGRIDMALAFLHKVKVPTLLVVGARDYVILHASQRAVQYLGGGRKLAVIPAASHLFEEAGTLEAAAQQVAEWCLRHMPRHEEW